MATMMRCNVTRAAARPSRSAVVVRASAEQPRRAVLGLLAGAVAGALLAAPQQASAIKIASQEFTGGMVVGGGSSPKSPTHATSSGYVQEGTRKQGVSIKTKKKLLAKLRKEAEKESNLS
ncbi:hypothetical protein Agub_g15718 [Astrephomene gubernaculifera]|uniref:Uncharacterized protein n=1 Tax=Astrephomene gubernaculifera TaxID=47775 RepID=A0AAD3E772_9CHLO|nr:hypothetical protein Agub_g15718 [Astrephomene gubernaculifera]